MSVRVMSLVFQARIPDLPYTDGGKTKRLKASTAKLILLAYADHANDAGVAAYPSLTLLEVKTSLTRQSVVNGIKALVQNGYLVPRGVSERGTNEYAINTQALAALVNPVDQQIDGVVNRVDQQVVNRVDQGSQPGRLKPSINHPINHPEGKPAANAAGRKRRARKTPPKPKAIVVYREVTHLYPPRGIWDDVASVVTDVDRWRRVVKAWVALGWNPRNIAGMLDYYRRGEIPSTAPRRDAPAAPRAAVEEVH